jgi:hypothetical protein
LLPLVQDAHPPGTLIQQAGSKTAPHLQSNCLILTDIYSRSEAALKSLGKGPK